MKHIFLLVFILPAYIYAQSFTPVEIKSWQQQSKNVTITRDNWGIPHIYGKSDADAVFGLLYAQCEDDFKRVEMNYIEKLGRRSEVYGKSEIYNDLLIKILIDTTEAKADYITAPSWLKKLLNAYADGINYYLYSHPGEKPALLKRFQPWFPMLWTDGSIGAINTADITTADLHNFYPAKDVGFTLPLQDEDAVSTGSNGFAIAPSISETGNALLYINPHVTFYFRPEVHMVSEEGLNAYGAVTWGQFFIYQGFNEFCGWMHTSSNADVADMYEEDITKKETGYIYKYNNEERTVTEKKISIGYKDLNGTNKQEFTIYSTHHGPVMAKINGKWISLKSNNRNIKGLIQCWKRTKVKTFEEYKEVMAMVANTSNNTVYADAAGNIAYWHGNFMPKRDVKYDWSKPVDGSTSETEWQGLHTVDETVHLYNPQNGWLQNCNSTAFTVAGKNSPSKNNYPLYMAPDPENFRGINAVRALQKQNRYTIDKLIDVGYDTYIMAFEKLIPALVKAYKDSKNTGLYSGLAEPIDVLKNWDLHCSTVSVATTLAIEWAYLLLPVINADEWSNVGLVEPVNRFAATASPDQLLAPLKAVIEKLMIDHGKWQIPWGEINRFQRISEQIEERYDDDAPSVPVPFVSSTWGMLPGYSASYFTGTKKRYGVHGNSFICAVEFGKRIKAKSLLAGGESGHQGSPHFNDQGTMYSQGKFKEVLFYKEDIMKNAEKTYHPGP